ncbi:sugar transferase [Nocardioides sp. NPDC092400]|uniref:sugar transferase n=1 Tax=Nocardioides sp. NPDC092400 TaxID=3155196 RepID=UPI0034456556
MTVLSERRSKARLGTPSRTLRYLPVISFVLDAVLLVTAVLVAVVGRETLSIFPTAASLRQELHTIGPLLVAGWLTTLWLGGAYRPSVYGAGTDEYKRVLNSSLATAALVGVACFFANYPLPRGFYALAFGIGIPALLVVRYVVRRLLHGARRRGALLYRVLIAGSPSHVDEVAAVLRREPHLGYRVVGALTPAHYLEEETRSGIPVLGNSDDATSIVLESGADIVFFASGALASSSHMRQIAWDLEHEHVQVVVAPGVTDVSSERVRIRPVGGLPLMHIDAPRATDASRWGKRLFDIVGSTALIVVFGPLFLIAAGQVKLHDRGPVFFRHVRVGRDGEEFGCLKFRTMVVEAESMVVDLQEQEGQSALLFKMRNDPRITRPGRWLRRYSVDELPQLFNVLKGDMSLIGPRPQVAREVALYDDAMRRRLRVRPGMTGLWQVSGRNDLSVTEAIRLDLYYVDNWSMMQDLSILAKTFGAVFGSRGAY